LARRRGIRSPSTIERVERREEIRVLGGQVLACAVDISDVGAVHRMVHEVVTQFGRIDILVNNAGRAQTKPMLDLTEADWDSVIDVNQRGTFFLIQAVARQMIRQMPEALRMAVQTPADIFAVQTKAGGAEEGVSRKGGAADQLRQDRLSSVAGRRRPRRHYAASKVAITSPTQSAALALALIDQSMRSPGDRAHPMGSRSTRTVESFSAPGRAKPWPHLSRPCR
jgi:NAD(P)-dependent dehydrogenase (short-subunit alcohol dehydrogenase family)